MKCPTAFISGYPSCIISEISGNIELIWWRILFCVKADPAITCCFCCDICTIPSCTIDSNYFISLAIIVIFGQTTYVTEFAKRDLTHASNFSTLRMCNSASVGPTALKFGGRPLLSLY